MHRFLLPLAALLFVAVPPLSAAEPANPWAKEILFQAPKTYPAPGLEKPDMEAIFYDALPWKGKPTRVFAYVGIPAHQPGEKLPAMVLVHGGGGTAFPEWVKRWNARGYAAIAMDTCGSTAGGENNKHPRHDFGGPAGWGGFELASTAPEDQWPFHAVADVILAHSLLRSRPEVDPARVGLTGISWGGYLTCIVSGVDDRFRFSVPVYGCGFLGEDSAWMDTIAKLGEPGQDWLRRWDPSVYVGRAKLPMLWVDGTNDFAYPLDSLQKTYRLPTGERSLCTRVRMPHGHSAGWLPEEINVYADHFLKGAPTLGRVSPPKVAAGTISATYECPREIAKAELNFTQDTGPWKLRKWETAPAELHANDHTTSAKLPDGATVAYLNLVDPQGLVISSEHVELPAK